MAEIVSDERFAHFFPPDIRSKLVDRRSGGREAWTYASNAVEHSLDSWSIMKVGEKVVLELELSVSIAWKKESLILNI